MSHSYAYLNGQLATGLSRITNDLSEIDLGGKWLVLGFFEGLVLAFKFENWQQTAAPIGNWQGAGIWESNLDSTSYQDLVLKAQSQIAAGEFYQVNVCHQYRTQWKPENNIAGLFNILQKNYQSKFASVICIEDEKLKDFGLSEIQIASASPELFLKVQNSTISSSPIKGTVESGAEFLDKDASENIMIVDLVRNDLSKVCETASIHVPQLLERIELPNLDHLVSTVAGQLKTDTNWNEIFSATFPPGSVTGAPKSSALNFISENEPNREIYCGAIGWVDTDTKSAELAVAIRTFWKSGNELRFGAGAGITWGSEPTLEWSETELKAHRLISIANLQSEVDK